jgi:hypothetical protein
MMRSEVWRSSRGWRRSSSSISGGFIGGGGQERHTRKHRQHVDSRVWEIWYLPFLFGCEVGYTPTKITLSFGLPKCFIDVPTKKS